MIEHNLIQMNRFCNDFHNDENVIFCKIDHILNEFEIIKEKKDNVILIICNGDYTLDDSILSKCPTNVKHIFSTNTTCKSDKVTPIPIGVEMQVSCKRNNHGQINPSIFEKLPFLLKEKKLETKKNNKILSNFSITTNIELRKKVRDIALSYDFYECRDNISFSEFVNLVKSSIATLSPRGNGIECIRTYEVLYLEEIPIVIGNFKEYEVIYENIYKNLPIVFLENLDDLKNYNLIESKIKQVQNNSKELIDYFYWKNLIDKKIKKIL